MARTNKDPAVNKKGVSFSLPEPEVAAVDAHAEQMSRRFNIRVTRTDALRNLLAAGFAAMAGSPSASPDAETPHADDKNTTPEVV